jgi:SnoaL-like domain
MTRRCGRVGITLLAAACLGLAAMAQAAESPELAAFKQATRALYDLKEKAFADDDPGPILERFYAPDVISTDEDGHTHIGTAEIAPLYAEVVPANRVRIESVHPHVNGNLGWDWANFFVTPDDPGEKPFSFKILFLWEKVDGRWICKGDMYTLGRFDHEASTQ